MDDGSRTGPLPRSRKARLTLLLCACLAVLANSGIALLVLREQRQAEAWVGRAMQTILSLKEIEDLAESSGRNHRIYQLSGDVELLDAYRAQQQEIPPQLSRLRALVTDDAAQARRLDALAGLIDQDRQALAASAAPIQLGADAGRTPSGLVASAQRTNDIVAAIDVILEEESASLTGRLALLSSRHAVTLATIALGTLGGLILVGLVYVLSRRDLRQSEQLTAAQSGALAESERRFRRIFEASPLGIVLADPEGRRIVQANPAFCRLVGSDAGDIAGRAIADLIHINDRALVIEAIAQRAVADSDGIEVRHVGQSGVIAWTRLRVAELSTTLGGQSYLLALIEDITREKRVEGELRQAQKMEAVGQLTGGIAHDFNNLLGVIIGNAEFLIDAVQERPEDADLAREILNSALSGADLTRRLLAFARRQTLQPRQVDLSAILPNHVATIRRLLGETIQVNANLAADLWPIRVDPSQVGDTLLNLAINARDAMPHGGRIAIETANARLNADQLDAEVAPGDYVMLAVTDSGIGMQPEVLERAVEPFFTTKAPGSGSGLGLSMIFGFAKQSGGHLHIDSEPGRGTTVRLYFPRATAGEVNAQGASEDTPLQTGHETILMVDDNAEMRAVGRRHLASLGYRVSEAPDGPAALAMLRGGEQVDLLFTDVVMPEGMTGYQLAEAARQMRPGLKVLFTSGYARLDPSAEVSAGEMIHKPYRKQDLAAKVRAALG